jgi:hypothetical protein
VGIKFILDLDFGEVAALVRILFNAEILRLASKASFIIQYFRGGIISGKGLEETLYYLTGKCDIGYQGVLCADCDITY